MEKDKGIFPFRKGLVGELLDGKKGRKRKGRRLRRGMGILLAAAVAFNTLPADSFAASASEGGLCEHHTEHTAECGYAEAKPCTHEHKVNDGEAGREDGLGRGEECYKAVTECVHTHTDECYPEAEETEESTGEGNAIASDAGNREPENCTHVCSEVSGCITKVLDCHHEHDENCGYKEAQECGYVCEICNGKKSEDTENTEDADTDTAEQEDTGICKHHQEHDEDCGYIPKSEDGEGSPCTYECRICPVEDLIAALPGDPVPAADSAARSGTCGSNLTWELDDSNTLTIKGTGAMMDYDSGFNLAPWNSSRDTITSVVILPGVTSIGNYAFLNLWKASTITIPETVTSIGGSAFVRCTALSSLTIPKSVISIGTYAFESAQNLSLTFERETPPTIDTQYTFRTAGIAAIYVPSGKADAYKNAFPASVNDTVSDTAPAIHQVTVEGIGFGGTAGDAYGENRTVTVSAGTKGGYTFTGWAAEGVTLAASQLNSRTFAFTMPASDVTLTANWEGLTAENPVAEVTLGDTTAKYATLEEAWDSLSGQTGTINLLQSVTASQTLTVRSGMDVKVEMADGVMLTNNSADCFRVDGGALTLAGGTVEEKGSGKSVVYAASGTLLVTGGNYTSAGNGFWIDGGVDVRLTGGTFTASGTLLRYGDKTAGEMLPVDYALSNGSSGKVTVSELSGSQFSGGGNSYTVVSCDHADKACTTNGDGTHSVKCLYCRYAETSMPHTYGNNKCSDCQSELRAKVESSGTTLYYETIGSAWSALSGQTGTVTLLQSANTDDILTARSGMDVTVEMADGVTLTAGKENCFNVSGGRLTLTESCTIEKNGDRNSIAYISGGELYVAGGTYKNNAAGGNGFYATKDATVRISGGTIQVVSGKLLLRCGGSSEGKKVSEMLAKEYGIFDSSDRQVTDLDTNELKSDGGAYTIKPLHVAKVELNGAAAYLTADQLDDAFAYNSGYEGATVTLLDDVTITEAANRPRINIRCTLNLNGHTIRSDTAGAPPLEVSDYGNVTITGSGEVVSNSNAALYVLGTAVLEGGTFCSGAAYSGAVEVMSGNLYVTGENVVMENTGRGGYGLAVRGAQCVQLSAGKYSGTAGAISVPGGSALSSLLNQEGTSRVAYYKDNATLVTEGLDGQTLPSGSYTVRACTHSYKYTHIESTTTHRQTCSACGDKKTIETCSYDATTGRCACGSTLAVTLSGAEGLVYNGAEQKPVVTVTVDGAVTLTKDSDYAVAYESNTAAGENTAKVTVTGTTFTGTATVNFSIGRAALTIKASGQTITYGGSIATGTNQVTSAGLVGGDTLESVTLAASTTDVPGGTIMPSAAQIRNSSGTDAAANYNIAYETGKLTVSYMEPPAAILYNGEAAKGWYNKDVKITADGYTVSDTLGRDYEASYTISAQEGTVTKTLYFKDAAGHMSDGVEVTVKFDLTPPAGEIAIGAKWWQNVLHFVSFGNYAAKEYTVSIKTKDEGGSGIDKTEYVIVTGSSQYTDVSELQSAVQESQWKEYDSSNRPAVSADTSQYVVYARLTDKVGNVTYISTDGILLDSTAPTVDALAVPEETKEDVTAGFTFTVSEAADYYYVVLPQDSAAPSAGDIIVTCGGTLPDGKKGTLIAGTFPKGSGAVSADTPGVSVDVKDLSPNTTYVVYVTAVDRALDISNSASGMPAGNIAAVSNAGFTTKRTLPVITKIPAASGTYGQSVGEMTITGGTAQAGSTALVGTWTVSDTDKNKKPSAGTEEVTVIFTPESDNYESVSVQAPLTVSQRNLNADGVTVSEAAGTYTYTGSEIRPPVAVNTGTSSSGISVSDSAAALTADDFTVSYSNNKEVGTASVTITGKGNYTGSVTRTFTIAKAPGREVPDLAGSYTDDGETYIYTVTPTDGAVYRMGDDGAWTAANEFKGIKPGTSVTFYAKMPETGNYEDGTPKSITVDFPKLTPAAPTLSYQADRTDVNDVKVTITPVEGAEYSFDGGTTWKSGEGANVQGGFTTSDTVPLAIRLKETDTHNPSPVQTVAVDLAKEDREAPPAFKLSVAANGETDYTVTIPPAEGCEYSFDGVTWSEVNVKTGVSVGETVTGYKRYKETNDYNAGSAVSAKETMPKFTVKTPVISPAGGSCLGSVSVTITCGSPDAEIYYTTDGRTPGRSSARYTGAFTVSVPATVKAVAVKDGLNDSAVATASYTKKDEDGSGGNGGNSGGNENNGGNDEGQGSGGNGSTNPGNGNTTPQPSVTPPTDTTTNPGNETAPGTETTPAGPGNGTAAEPGTAPGSGLGTSAEGTGQPFIKGEDGKIGWDVIRAEEEKAEEGSIINVDMNGTTVVPGDIFDRLKGKDITITFDMGSGILWSVDGKSITTDKVGDIDFSVKTETNAIPVDIVNNVTGERYSIQISLAHEGEFGFTAVLSIGLGRENAGYTASLYYYNTSTGELEFICSGDVAEDGTVSLAFTHASVYVIAIDAEEESGSTAEPAQSENQDEDGSGKAENPQAAQAWRPWWFIAAGALVIIMGVGVFFVVKKKKESRLPA